MRQNLAATVLFILGLFDLARGLAHTFFIDWAVATFAHLDLSSSRNDQLMLLGAFGISNILTGVIYILISRKAPVLARPVLLIIPCAYALGVIGLKVAGVTPQSAFLGKYIMFAYFAVCLATFAISGGRGGAKTA